MGKIYDQLSIEERVVIQLRLGVHESQDVSLRTRTSGQSSPWALV